MRARHSSLAVFASLMAFGLLGTRVASAGDAPQWVHAQVNAPLPAHDDKTSAVVLFSETILTVQSNGRIKKLEREVLKILRPDGEAFGNRRFNFDKQSPITALRAWCVPVAGKDYEVKEKDSVESAVFGVDDGSLVSDERTKTLQIPAATPGNIIAYEIEQEMRPYFMADEWGFEDTIPVREAHYTLELPSGWSYQANWLNYPERMPSDAGAGRWRWSVNDIAAVRIEQLMPPWQGIASRMVVALVPPNGQGAGTQSWKELGAWYLNLTRGRRDASPQIKQKVAELTGNVPTPWGKIQALSAFVQNDIRYVAIELGIGGQQPHPAIDVFNHRYGDCKDKVTLLSTMLKEIGVESYYVIINAERGAVTASTLPNLQFNHVILAIALPVDLETPPLRALIAHPKLGKVLFFDPTDDLTPVGRIPGNLQANYGMLVTPDGGELLQLPQLPVDLSGTARTARLTLDDKGTLRGEMHEIRSGDEATDQRRALRAISRDTDRIRMVETVAATSLSTFRILNAATADVELADRPFEWNYTLEAANYAKTVGDLLLVRPRVLGIKARGFLETKEPRQHPVEFEGPRRDTDIFEIELPAGYKVDELPHPVDIDDGFASYRSKTEIAGGTLRYTRTLEIKDLSVPVNQTEKLRMFYRIIADDERNSAVLKRTAQ